VVCARRALANCNKPFGFSSKLLIFKAIAMSATVISLPPNSIAETVAFLRRLASMMAGGRNAEMLLQAASQIEALSQRAMAVERLYHAREDESARNLEQREVADMAADRLIAETELLKTELVEAERQAEIARVQFAGEAQRLQALVDDAEARLAHAHAELGELRTALATRRGARIAVPIQTLELARAQFSHLAESFAREGDLISQTICEIGGCAIDQALKRAADERA
jgi:hypothetical protein